MPHPLNQLASLPGILKENKLCLCLIAFKMGENLWGDFHRVTPGRIEQKTIKKKKFWKAQSSDVF